MAVITGRPELINPFIKAAAEDHTDADCLIVVAMSHGEAGFLHSFDFKYPVEMLWAHFTGDKCPTLIGKPKLFFIQVSYYQCSYGGSAKVDPVQRWQIINMKCIKILSVSARSSFICHCL